MLIKKEVEINGIVYPVILSDDRQALQAAYAAGGAVVGLYGKITETEGGEEFPDLSPALYVAETKEDADEELLKKAVCRRFGLPLEIAETKRLKIREFRAWDRLSPEEEEFKTPESLSAYIACQYRFYECGLWALEEKEEGKIVGKAGITDGELGYHIYRQYRRNGFALEACQAILAWAECHGLKKLSLKVRPDNLPSISLAKKLGFQKEEKRGDGGELIFSQRLSGACAGKLNGET